METACRGGWPTTRPFGNSPTLLDAYGWFAGNADLQAHPVASLKPNDLGFFDVLGNVNEWCLNAYDAYRTPLAAMAVDNKLVTTTSANTPRVIRGGSFNGAASELRSANRTRQSPNLNTYTVGFRVARTEAP